MPQNKRPAQQVSLAVMLIGNSIVALAALTLCVGMFSILPFSVSVMVLPINFFAFAFFHDRMTSRQYIWLAILLFVGVLTVLMLGIAVFGRQPFAFLLG
jgi:hypothetical protein